MLDNAGNVQAAAVICVTSIQDPIQPLCASSRNLGYDFEGCPGDPDVCASHDGSLANAELKWQMAGTPSRGSLAVLPACFRSVGFLDSVFRLKLAILIDLTT